MTRPALLLATAIATTILSPAVDAQSIYFHSPTEQALTADFATRLTAARTTHIAALDRHDADLQAAMAEEQAAIVRQELARRDAVLTQQLDGKTDMLNATVKAQLQSLTGASPTTAFPALSDADEETLQADIEHVQRKRNEWDRQVASVRREEDDHRLTQGQVNRCDETALPSSPKGTAATAQTCSVAQSNYWKLMQQARCDRPEPSRTYFSVATGTFRCWNPITKMIETVSLNGEIGDALKAAELAAIALTRQAEAASIVQNELATLQNYIICQQKLAAQPGPSEEITAAFAQLDGFLKDVATLTDTDEDSNKAVSDRAPLPACPGQPDANGSPRLDKPLATLKAILAGSRVAAETRGIGAAAAQAAERFRASLLGEIVQAAADPTAIPSGKAPAIVAALVRSATPVAKLAQARAGTLPDTSGALVALAEAKLRAANAAIEVDRLQRVATLSQRKVVALSNEVLLLRQAIGAKTADERTILYAASVERGRIPARVLATRIDNLEYDAWARRERAAVEAGYAALTPAAVELKAYGEGGIKAETIARFLNVAGLAAIAGTN